MIDKFVKLSAIEKMAQPMEALHGKGMGKGMGEGMGHGKGEYASGGSDWECPDCGTMVMATKDSKSMECPCCGSEMEPAEDSEADKSEDAAEGETED